MTTEELRDYIKEAESRVRQGVVLSKKGSAILAQLKATLLECDHGKGAVAARKNRRTGTTVVVYRPGTQASIEEQWQVVCVEHGGVLSCETRALAESAMAIVHEWCPYCSGQEA